MPGYLIPCDSKVGTLNRTGKPYLGSHDIWTRNRIARLVDITTDVMRPPYQECRLITWLNGDDFEPARESFGILPFTPATRMKIGMSPYQAEYAKGCKIKHDYLAGQQQTLVAVLPVHTVEEKALYRLLLKSNTGQFSGEKQPDWITLAQEWQRHANGTSIFYKVRVFQTRQDFHSLTQIFYTQLPEHLKSYFKTWNEHQNEHNSVEQNKRAYDELQKLLSAPIGMPEIALARRETVANQVASGTQPAVNDEPSDWQISVALGRNSSRQTLLQLQYNNPAPPGPGSHGQKRPAEESAASIQVKQRAQRTCKRCCKADCPGKFRSRPCKYKPVSVVYNTPHSIDALKTMFSLSPMPAVNRH